LAALGVETIQFITTEKTQRTLHGSQELARAQKIIRAAAEQSKYFCLPLIKGPVNLMVYLEQQHTRGDLALVADPDGHSVRELIADRAAVSQATILVGPEGGLTVSERDLVAQHGFVSCRLTPTILKAEHAVSLLAGIVRSIF
jgi:16S rRNA (uracil1498-N3)-methyltransferase